MPRTHAITVAIEGHCPAANERDLEAVAAHALGAEKVVDPVALGIVLVDDATIHRMNREYLAHDEPTDIITFALEDDTFITGPTGPGKPPRELGEMYISYERAAAQSADWGSDPEREIRFLVVHGVLHLLGWDDATTEERERMLARQDEILADWTPRREAR